MTRSIASCLIFAVWLVVPATIRAQEEGEPQEDTPRESGHGHHHGDQRDHGEHDGHGGHDGHGTDYRHDTMEHDFSSAEKWSARFDASERKAWQKPEEVVELMAIEPGMTVVDLGAGTGYFLSHLSYAAGEGGRVLALDPEPDMIHFMQDRAQREGLANVDPKRIPFDDPELDPASVDRVLIVNTWHHIQEREAYAEKLFAALAPGGAVYVVDFTRDSPSGPPVEERLDPERVVAELTAGGLEAATVDETLPRQYVVAGRRPE